MLRSSSPASRTQRAPLHELRLSLGRRALALHAARLATRLGARRAGRRLARAALGQPGEVVVHVAVEFAGLAVGNQQESVAHRPQQRAVVRDQHQAALVSGEGARQRVTHLEIEVIGGLVQQQQVRSSADDHRQRQARALAAGEGADRRVRHRAAEVEVAEVAAQLEFACRGFEVREVLQRGFVGPQLLELVLGEIAGHEAITLDPSPVQGRQLAGDRLDQRGLASTVRAQQSESRPRRQGELDALEHGAVRIAERRVLECEERRGGPRRGRELEVERRVHVRRGDPLQAVERLEPALRLAGLGRLGAEALDELRDVRDFPALLLEQRLLAREPRGALFLERRVIAGVEGEPQALDVRHVRDAGVEEVAVVGDEQQGAAIAPRASARARRPRRGRGGWWARRAAAAPRGSAARVRD